MRLSAICLVLLSLSCYNGPAHAVWSFRNKPNQDVTFFCRGDGQAIAGYSFTSGTTVSSSSSSSGGGSSSSSSHGSNSQSTYYQAIRSIKQEKTVLVRVFCLALDGSTAVKSTASISATGAGSNGQAREAEEFSAADGLDVEDKQKNCQEGEYICGLKVSQGGTRFKNLCCKPSQNYEADSASGCRIIGPIPYSSNAPVEIQNPSSDNKGCSVDAAVGLGLGDDGIKIKTCSFKKKRKQVDSGCKQKKDQAVQQYVQQKTSSSSSFSSSSSSQSFSSQSSSSQSSSSQSSQSSSSSDNTSAKTSSGQNSQNGNNNGAGNNGNKNGSKGKAPESAGKGQKSAGKGAKSAAKNAGKQAGQQGQNAGNNAAKGGQATGQNAAQQGQNAGQTGQNLGQNAGQAGQNTGQNAAQAGQNAGQTAAQQGQNAGSAGQSIGQGAAAKAIG